MLETIFILLGIALIGLSVAGTVVNFVRRAQINEGEKHPIRNIPKWAIAAFATVGVFSILFQPLTYYAEPGYHYLVQFPNGTQVTEFQPGYHFSWFGNVIPFKQVISVLNVSEAGHANSPVSAELPPIEVRFNDSVSAHVDVASRFRLSSNPDQFKKTAIEFRTQENLINATLTRAVNEVVRNSARMFSAQEYIAGRGGEFESAVLDQIMHGVYVLKVTETNVRHEESVTQDDSRVVAGDEKRVQLIVEKVVDANGQPVRKPNPLAEYGIEVTQCTLSRVDPEEKFKEMLAKQRDAAATANVERQRAKTAGFEKLRVEAEGEAAKAQVRVEEEKKQIVQLITAETRQKNEKIKLEEEKLKRDQAAVQAEAIKLMASAEAEKRQKIMAADNALQIRLDTEVQIHKAYAEALKDKKLVPDVVITGGSGNADGGSAVDLLQLIKAKLAKDLAERSPSPEK